MNILTVLHNLPKRFKFEIFSMRSNVVTELDKNTALYFPDDNCSTQCTNANGQFYPNENTCYWRDSGNNQQYDYSTAQTYCSGYPQAIGGRLPTPLNSIQLSNLQSMISNFSFSYTWLGAQFFASPQNLSNIMWMSNTSTDCGGVTYIPNTSFNNQAGFNCIEVNTNQWKDQDCSQTRPVVCEFGIKTVFLTF